MPYYFVHLGKLKVNTYGGGTIRGLRGQHGPTVETPVPTRNFWIQPCKLTFGFSSHNGTQWRSQTFATERIYLCHG